MSTHQDSKPPELAEALTTRRLLASLASETCPACGTLKFRKQTMCPRCYRKLPSSLKHALYRGIESGYERAVAAAMKSLGRTRFIMPGEDPTPIGQAPLTLDAVAPLVVASFESEICPKCAGGKGKHWALCGECRSSLRVRLGEDRGTLFNGAEPPDLLTNRALLSADPDQYAGNLIRSIQILKGKVFHYPKE